MTTISPTQMQERKEYLSSKEAAELIGRTPAAVRNLVKRHKIPFRKRGKLIFLRRELQAWIEEAPGLRIEDLDLKE